MGDMEPLPKILLVDDKPENLLALGKLLKQFDVEIFKALSGEEALSLVLRHHFAVILLDVQMPGMDGFETAQLVHANSSSASVPIIFVTAISKDERHVAQGYASGAVDYLYKPINPDILAGKVHVFLQIEQQRLQLEQLTHNLTLMGRKNRLLLDSAGEGIMGIDLQGGVEFANPAAAELFGQTEQNLMGQNVTALFEQPGVLWVLEQWQSDQTPQPVRSQTCRLKRAGSQAVPVEFNFSAMRDSQEQMTGGVLVFQDITERVALQEQLTRQATYDSLTGLANRRLFMESVQAGLACCQRHNHRPAVLFLDLDHFKPVNDTLGHEAGDALLVSVAERLCKAVGEQGLVARLGGDEFAIFMENAPALEVIEELAQRVIAAINQPHTAAGQTMNVGTSIGIAQCPAGGASAEELIKAADTAMYHLKESGRNGYYVYTSQLHADSVCQQQREQAIAEAIDHGHFELLYQPVVDITKDQLHSCEVQLRWHHNGETQDYEHFCRWIATQKQRATLGGWTVQQGLTQMQVWRAQSADRERAIVAINLPAALLGQHNFQQTVEQALEGSVTAPELLQLEIAEATAAALSKQALAALASLRQQGVGITVDQFGSHGFVVNTLQELPANAVKIAPQAVRSIGEDSGTEQLIEAVVTLAHTLGVEVAAEGVQSSQQLLFLQDVQCDHLQGQQLAPPLALDQIAATSGFLCSERARA